MSYVHQVRRMIALSTGQRFSAARYSLTGSLSRNATWSQTLELPADDSTVSITGQSIEITFRRDEFCTTAELTVSTAASQISITDADTIAIIVTDEIMGALKLDRYVVDIASSNSGAITHWAHGIVSTGNSPVVF